MNWIAAMKTLATIFIVALALTVCMIAVIKNPFIFWSGCMLFFVVIPIVVELYRYYDRK